jgi:preprotein translocase subunit SecD
VILQVNISKSYRVHLLLPLAVLVFTAMACSRLRSQNSLKWQLVLQIDPATPFLEGAVANTVGIIERRLELFGIRDFKVTVQQPVSSGRIQVNLPTVPQPERIKELLTSGGNLEIVQIKSIAFVKSQISDTVQIPGRFTKQSAEDLAWILNSGPFPAPERIIEERNN